MHVQCFVELSMHTNADISNESAEMCLGDEKGKERLQSFLYGPFAYGPHVHVRPFGCMLLVFHEKRKKNCHRAIWNCFKDEGGGAGNIFCGIADVISIKGVKTQLSKIVQQNKIRWVWGAHKTCCSDRAHPQKSSTKEQFMVVFLEKRHRISEKFKFCRPDNRFIHLHKFCTQSDFILNIYSAHRCVVLSHQSHA